MPCFTQGCFSNCRYTLNPNTRLSQVWEVVGVVMSLVSVLSVSTQAAFLHNASWLWIINYIADLYFVADMLGLFLHVTVL